MGEVVVASYNMSFMSDLKKPLSEAQWASEATFLTRNKNKDDRRQYWKNALKHLYHFVKNEIKQAPFVVGLQEINLTNEDSKTGSDAINKIFSLLKLSIEHVCREVFVAEDNKPALSIIYDKDVFGQQKEVRILDNWCQKGRPLLMVLTKNGYVFANMHGAQNPPDGDPYKSGDKIKFNESMVRMNKRFLENSLEDFLKCNGFSKDKRPTGIFITGDFNDRYDAIKEFNIFGARLRYNGESPYSCCHNWDSSCSDKNYKALKDFRDEKVKQQEGEGKYCELPDENKRFDEKTGLKLPMPWGESKIELYRYKGDKVFAEIDDTEMKASYGKIDMFNLNSRKSSPSQESDHELVYAKFPYKLQTVYTVEGKFEDIKESDSQLLDLDIYSMYKKAYLVKNNDDLSKKIRNKILYDIKKKDKNTYTITFNDRKNGSSMDIDLSKEDILNNFIRDPYDFMNGNYTSTDKDINDKIKDCILFNVERHRERGIIDNNHFKFIFECKDGSKFDRVWNLDTIATLKYEGYDGGRRRRKTRRSRKNNRKTRRPRKNNRKTRK